MRAYLLFGLCVLSGCAERDRVLQPGSCRAIELSGQVSVLLQHAETARLELSGKALETIQVDLDGGVRLVAKEADAAHIRISCPERPEVSLLGAVSLENEHPEVTQFSIYGSSELVSSRLRSDTLTIRASGDARVALEGGDFETLTLLGGSRSRTVVQKGTAQVLNLTLTGEASADVSGVRAQTVYVDLAGKAAAGVWATAHLAGSIRADSRLAYDGTPDLQLAPSEGAIDPLSSQ